MLNSTLEIVVTTDKTYKLADFFGNLDSYSLKEKKQEIVALSQNLEYEYLVFNLQNLNFINSESIGLFLQTHETVVAQGKKFVLMAAKKNVYDVLNVIGLLETIPYFRTKDDFLKNLNK